MPQLLNDAGARLLSIAPTATIDGQAAGSPTGAGSPSRLSFPAAATMKPPLMVEQVAGDRFVGSGVRRTAGAGTAEADEHDPGSGCWSPPSRSRR